MYRTTIPAGTLAGLKAAPGEDGSTMLQDSGTTEDWSGLYVQVSVAAAVNYVPNQWTRGEQKACLMTVTTVKDVPVIVCPYQWMGDVLISSAIKAKRLRECLEQELDIKVSVLIPDLGALGFVIAAVDSDDLELIVPHNLVSSFRFSPVAVLSQDEKYALTTGECVLLVGAKIIFGRRIASDSKQLGVALDNALRLEGVNCEIARMALRKRNSDAS